jgi:hypothetical protein
VQAGSAIKYARGYKGIGAGMSQGGVIVYYHILSEATSASITGEQVTLEVEQKKVVGL